jgi:hypothetical protein
VSLWAYSVYKEGYSPYSSNNERVTLRILSKLVQAEPYASYGHWSVVTLKNDELTTLRQS